MKQLLILLAALGWVGSVASQTEVEDARILSFEESVAPFDALRGSRLTLSDEHYKHGQRSLHWQWSRSGAQLVLRSPIGYCAENPNPKETSVSSFVFWLYAPQATEGSLRFEFQKQGRTCAWFDYQLGFTGWRGAWIAFDRDMQGTPEEGMDGLRITAHGVRRGDLYLDHLILSSFQDVRHHTADLQAPFINASTTSHWLVLLQSWRNPMPEAAATLSEAQRQDLATVEGRLRELLLEHTKPLPIKTLRERFAEYAIAENADGTLRGKPIWFVRYAETYINLGHPDVKNLFEQNHQTLRRYNDFLFQVAVAWNAATDASERAELARIYVLLTRHLLDQGFAAGSAQGTLHHLGYSMRNFYTAPVIMRDVLRQAGLEHDVQQAMEWFSGVGEVKIPPRELGMDIDAFNTSLIGRLSSIVMLPDSPVKAAYLNAFSAWVDNGYKITEGTSACFKSDGTVFHHRHHYPAYAVGGFDGGVNAVWLLAGTHFAVSRESHEILKRALLEMRFYCNLRSFPLAMSGRHPDGLGELIPWHYARLSTAGAPDGSTALDTDLAAAYLRLAPREDAYVRRFKAAGIEPEPSPQGTRVYGYNASLSHRCADWLLTVAGHSRYIWAAEIYQGANHYGRYLAHGSVQLLGDGDPIGSFGSGFRQEGWDWCHIPGTTALEIPMPQMKADVRNVDEFSGYEEMLLSDESFAGGVSLPGVGGAYGVKLHEHDKYNGSLRARKSYFLFENRLIALGSDLENEAEGELHTTLFQNFLNSESEPISINGTPVTTFPDRQTLPNGGVVGDNLGNLYFVPSGEVCISRELQHSLHEESDAPTQNNFAKAYLRHGTRVKGGRYEYMMLVHATPEQTAACMAELPYEVLRQERSAHIVRDKASQTTAYVLFESGAVNVGQLQSVSLPSLVMIRPEADALTLSVCDPDLRFYEGASDEKFDADGKRIERSIYSRDWIDSPSRSSALRVTLRDEWLPIEAPTGCEVEYENGNTVLTITCREAAPRTLKLKKR